MNTRSTINGRLLAGLASAALVVLAACAPGAPQPTACHYTGDEAAPYEEVTITAANASEHLGHPNDFMPVPVGGCSTTPVEVTNGKFSICHATSSTTNPYNEISIDANGLNGHGKHEGDLIPVPEDGCPATLVDASGGKITICHATGSKTNPFNQITVSVDGLNGHNKHQGDIVPVPAGGCPATAP